MIFCCCKHVENLADLVVIDEICLHIAIFTSYVIIHLRPFRYKSAILYFFIITSGQVAYMMVHPVFAPVVNSVVIKEFL